MKQKRTLIGILTPSSNTVLEPFSSAMVAKLENVSVHFGRFRVTEISFGEKSQSHFNLEKQLEAASLLEDAQVGSIIWSGTSASWLGFETDNKMCEAIKMRTGISAGSSVLAINEILDILDIKRFGLVSPYIDDIQNSIIRNYSNCGFECVAERHLNKTRNYEFADFSEEIISELILDVAANLPDAIVIMCTNMRGARIAQKLEKETGILVLDSVSAAIWTGMRIAGDDPTRITDWGRIFAVK